MRLNRSNWAVGVSILLMSTVLIGWLHPARRATVASRPECPQGGAWTEVFKQRDGIPNPFGISRSGEVPLSGAITDIIEFHDCQQFIVEDSKTQQLRYSSLFAIFARANLERDYVPVPAPTGYVPKKWGVPMATIFAYDSAYDRLGIKRGFNCLYFFVKQAQPTVVWSARMVPAGNRPQDCTTPIDPILPSGKDLTVTTVPPIASTPDDSPPVARWDWDSANHLQYIGVRCGAAWCEVHPEMTTGQVFNSSPELTGLPHHSKGWYDEQLLTVANGATGEPKVSEIRATLVPDSLLGQDSREPSSSRFANQWIPVGSIIIRSNPGGYASKLNLINAGETAADNLVSLCYATQPSPNRCFKSTNVGSAIAPACTPTGWYGRIEHIGTGAPKLDYFCVTRRAHDMAGMRRRAPLIPGVARWRWMLDDETIWIRCLQGCCEVKPHQ